MTTITIWDCPSTQGPGPCHNHTHHEAPRGCVHHSSYVPDRHDRNEGTDEE